MPRRSGVYRAHGQCSVVFPLPLWVANTYSKRLYTEWTNRQLSRWRHSFNAIATSLNARSNGVKDLRFGACLDEDWRDADPDEFLRDRCRETPFLPRAAYHFVAATVTPSLLGIIAGDQLVRSQSAAGRGRSRRIPFDAKHGLTLTGLNHFDLLNHPLVYAKLRDWLAPPGAAAMRAATSAATANVSGSSAAE
jgi:hypothetical protein